METQIVTPEVQKETETALPSPYIKPEIEKSISQEIFEAQSLIIKKTEHYEMGQIYMARIKQRIKTLEEERMSQTRLLDQAKKRIMDFFLGPLEKLNNAKNHLNTIMVKWVEEQERIRREEERRLQEEARKRAEEEALHAAIQAEKEGDTMEAEKIISEPVYVPPIKVVSGVPKSKESHIRETWSCEVMDLKALVMGIAQGKAPLQAVEANLTFLNSQARSYKQALNIPGVRAVSKKTQL